MFTIHIILIHISFHLSQYKDSVGQKIEPTGDLPCSNNVEPYSCLYHYYVHIIEAGRLPIDDRISDSPAV